MTIRQLLLSLAAAAALSTAAGAHAGVVVDTGAPNGNAIGAYALDGTDWTAAEVSFASAAQVDSVLFHVLGGSAGDSFHVSLYTNGAGGLPGTELYTGVATYTADGWNGLSGLSGWSVDAGSYWLGVEVWDTDTLGSSSIFGAVLDQGAPTVLQDTAFSASAGTDYALSGPESIGLQVDASAVSAVPEVDAGAMMAWGLSLLSVTAFIRRRQK